MKVAVTGGLACGKSSVCQFFEELGAYVVSADKIVQELLGKDEVASQVADLLGEEVIREGRLDRQKVAEIVFNQPDILEELEKILHPAVFEGIESHMARAEGHPLFVAEIPLLFETGAETMFDKTVAVICSRDQSITRLGDEAKFKRRSKRQLSPEEKARRADIVIDNNGSLAELKKEVATTYEELTR